VKQSELIHRRAFKSQSPELLQVCFQSAVLDAYRGRAGFKIIRTDSAGRLKQEGGWSIDFGISGDDQVIHVSWRDMIARFPESEREAWAGHIVTPPLSANFLQMQLAPGSCFDDGEVRPW
jgi:hypothetical protein